jgi:hypothetical protein
MANANFRDQIDLRIAEAAVRRFEAARAVHRALQAKKAADEVYQRARDEHSQAVIAYDDAERDIACGVRARRAQAVAS